MSDSDGTLAKVSYFPGVAKPSEPAEVSAAPSVVPRDDEGWYVDPADNSDRDASTPESADRKGSRVRGNVAPLRPVAFVPTDEVDDAAQVTTAPAADASPALAKMRALIAEAEKKAASAAADVAAAVPTRQRRAVTPKFVAEDPDDEDRPPSREELAARAERISMSALTRKGMSSWELAERLRAQDLDENTVATEIERLERVGLLDDRDLAEMLVRTLQERKGLGRSGITAELRRRHVDPDAIEEALGALDTDDESARALEIAVKRAPQLRSLDSTTAQRRLSAFLMRKGYSSTAISYAVAGALKGTSGPRFR
jgi:regulatory protein